MRHKWSDRDQALDTSGENSHFVDVMLLHSKNRCDHPKISKWQLNNFSHLLQVLFVIILTE